MTKAVYVLLHPDLKNKDKLPQACHAAHTSGNLFGCPEGCYMIVLKCRSKHEWKEFMKTCKEKNILYCKFFEPDLDMITSLATEPIDREVGKIFSSYKTA